MPTGDVGTAVVRGIREALGVPAPQAPLPKRGPPHNLPPRRMFVGRKDDLISSGGYRIGPSEIEDCLHGHPAVALAAAIGAPDPVRGDHCRAADHTLCARS